MKHGAAQHLAIAFREQDEVLPTVGAHLDQAAQPFARDQRVRLKVDRPLQSPEGLERWVFGVFDPANAQIHTRVVAPPRVIPSLGGISAAKMSSRACEGPWPRGCHPELARDLGRVDVIPSLRGTLAAWMSSRACEGSRPNRFILSAARDLDST